MRRHAKAATAPTPGHMARSIVLLAATLAAMALFVTPASASKVHLFKEVFGSVAKPGFGAAIGMAVDSSGHLLVMDGTAENSDAGTISRFNPDGTPDNFPALGTNVIDGKGTADATPQEGLDFHNTVGSSEAQIAVDNSGGPNDGDIYVTQASPPLVNIFSEEGEYLGQLTESSAGPFTAACGVAVDPSGAVYVGDYTGGIHKFTPAVNPPVNADNSANFNSVTQPCNLAAGIGPSAGFLYAARLRGPVSKIDSSSGELKYVVFGGTTFTVFVNPANGHLFSAGQNKIHEFDVSGAASATSVASFEAVEAGFSVRGVAARGTSDIYVNVVPKSNEAHVQVYDGAVASQPDVSTEAASEVEPTSAQINGTVNPDGEALTECLFEVGPPQEYGESTQQYTETVPCVPDAAGVGSGTSPVAVHADLNGLAIGSVHHYRLRAANAHGPAFFGEDASFQTAGPVIEGAWSEGVTLTEATLKAAIDPEGSPTTYRFEWGTTTSYGNVSEGNAGSDSSSHQATVFLESLSPGTTYHYRVVAISSIATNEGPDLTFTTAEPFAADTNCANQAFRYGAGAALPDCRAYEMVSPVDKDGASIRVRASLNSYELSSNQAALDGDKIAYSSYKSFGDSRGSYFSNEYIATRGPEGWSSHGIDPPHKGSVNGFTVDVGLFPPEFGAFTEDLSTGFLLDDAAPALTPDGLAEHYNYYLRDNRTETYKALTTQLFSEAYTGMPGALQGYSKDGSHAVFALKGALTANAVHNIEESSLYDYSGGKVHLVSVLPGGEGVPGVAGAPGNDYLATVLELGNTEHAVSDDGSRIFWSTDTTLEDTGRIFARINDATTIPVSESVTPSNNATYWTASTDGSQVIFSVGGNLYSFDVDSETVSPIAGEVTGFLGAGDDLSYMYFVSEEDLAAGAIAGKQNLYLDREGTMTLVAILSKADLGGVTGEYNIASGKSAIDHFSRVTPDGRHLAFQSLGDLTGYDNTSANSGEPAVEVYLYDASSQQLTCASCNPSGVRPVAERLYSPYQRNFDQKVFYGAFEGQKRIWAAAWLPSARRITHLPRSLSDDGKHLFFNSFDPLVPRDTNGAQDVYEWEAQGKGSCTKPGGCVSLISTGENPEESEFIDASQDGRDVFISTSAGIDPRDNGLIDIYDAREGGGYPPPPPAPTPCFGDACQSPPPAPNDQTPASAAFKGAGSPLARKARNCAAQAKRATQLTRQAKGLREKAKRAAAGKAKDLRSRSARYAKQAKQLDKDAARCRGANRRAGR